MVVAAATAVVAHQPDAVREPRIVGDHRAGVAKRAEVLAGVEAEAADVPDRAREPSAAPPFGGGVTRQGPPLLSRS
jgi:hypothetical protein